MKKKPAARKSSVRNSTAKKSTSLAKAKPDGLGSLIAEVRQLIQSARRGVSSVIDTFQVMTNFEIGRRIVEHEQQGAKRAGYGQEMLKSLSARLTEEFGRGFSVSNLQAMRRFFIEYQIRIQQQATAKLVSAEFSQKPTGSSVAGQIQQQPTVELTGPEIWQQPAAKLPIEEKSQKPSGKLPILQKPSGKSGFPFTLSWTHYVELLTVRNPDERSFYEIEATNEGWSVPELNRTHRVPTMKVSPSNMNRRSEAA